MTPEQNLLFGVLARKARLISTEQFNEACKGTAGESNTALADVLVAQGHITPEQRREIEALLENELTSRGGDCLATLRGNLDADVLDSLQDIDEPTLQRSIAQILLPPPAFEQDAKLKQLFVVQPAAPHTAGDRYQRLRLHASGGIGRIWVAKDGDLGREVALKELLSDAGDDPDMRRRFLEEARITGRLEHPGIVPIYELASEKDGKPFYVMRFIKGRTLSEAIRDYHSRRRKGEAQPLELNNLLGSFIAVCNAVAYAHSRNVIHRDLKGPNVILGEFGEVLVLDWGLAKEKEKADGGGRQAEGGRAGFDETQQGHILGTPAYMPPEQAAGRLDLLDARSDVYSLGVILYEILAGRLPFERHPSAPPPTTPEEFKSSLLELLGRVQTEPPPKPRAINSDIPRALQAICLKALSKPQAERYATAKELASDVQRWLADEPVSVFREPFSTRAARWSRKHKALVTGAAGLLITALIALAVSTILIGREQVQTENARRSAVRNFRIARDNAEKFFVHVSENKLLQEPGMQKLREELLQMAQDFYEESIQEYTNDPSLKGDMGKALLASARTSSELGRHQRALEKIGEAINIFDELLAKQPDNTEWKTLQGFCLLNKGVFLFRLKESAKAEAAFETSQAMLRGLNPTPEQSPELVRKIAYAEGNLGILRQGERDYAKAQSRFEEALALHKELARLNSDDPAYQDDLASAHTNLGILLARRQQGEASERHLVKALEIHRSLAKKINNIAYQRHLARSLNNMGIHFRFKDKIEESLEAYSEALKIREHLAEKNPEVMDYQAELADLYMNIGIIYNRFREKAKEAAADEYAKKSEQHYVRAREIFERLTKQSPENPDYPRGIGWALSTMGDLAYILGQKTATDRYQKSIKILQSLFEKGIRTPEVREPLRNAYWGLGEIAFDDKRWETAIGEFKKAVPLDDGRFRDVILERWAKAIRAFASANTHSQVAPFLADISKEQQLPPEASYDLAWTLGGCIVDARQQGDKGPAQKYGEQTVRHLINAEKAGYFRQTNVEKSLSAFREIPEVAARPEFAELLQRLMPPPTKP